MKEALRIGISPCPNDTYAFHGLLSGAVRDPDLPLHFELLDIQELNAGLAEGRFAIAKASYLAAMRLGAQVDLLAVGSALGFGNGPLLLAAPQHDDGHGRAPAPGPGSRVLAPGAGTTATLLYEHFYGSAGAQVTQTLFSDIPTTLEAGSVDYGVAIHEARFTYRDAGLALVEDLGLRFERETGQALPLGGLFCAKSLDPELSTRFVALLRKSLALARAEPEAALKTMREHAQELSAEAIQGHVDLYVNAHTEDLGAGGLQAVRALESLARATGHVPEAAAPLKLRP